MKKVYLAAATSKSIRADCYRGMFVYVHIFIATCRMIHRKLSDKHETLPENFPCRDSLEASFFYELGQSALFVLKGRKSSFFGVRL